MDKITPTTTIVRTKDLLMTDLDEETILMGIEQGAYYGMEETARRIWELLETPQTVAGLCARLAEEYKVDPELFEREVLSFLEELLRERLVTLVSENKP